MTIARAILNARAGSDRLRSLIAPETPHAELVKISEEIATIRHLAQREEDRLAPATSVDIARELHRCPACRHATRTGERTRQAKGEVMRVHYLKTWPAFFAAVKSGKKPFEIRKDDREYDVGDTLILQYWDPAKAEDGNPSSGYTGDEVRGEVEYLLLANDCPGGLVEGFCVMGVRWNLSANPGVQAKAKP